VIRILSRIKSQPWACTPEVMETIMDIANRQNLSPEAVAKEIGRPLRNSYDVEMRDSVGILPMQGPLIRYATMFSQISGATSYDMLAQDFARMVNDPAVSAIILNIDSPGGEANGVSEFADQIAAARGIKPIVAYVGGMGASAAYWLAAAADEIVISDTAVLGSIGTIMSVTDTKEKDAKAGVKTYTIVSSQSPHKALDASTEDGQNRLQVMVDSLSEVFIAKVAQNRGVDAEAVLQNFGQGGVFVGQSAVNAGLADRVGSFEGLLAELQNPNPAFSTAQTQAAATGVTVNASEEIGMNKDEVAEKFPDIAAAFRSEGKAEGVTAERARIKGILACEDAGGRIELAQELAFGTDMAAESAVALLAKAPKAAAPQNSNADALAAAMAKVENPNVGADVDENADTVEAAVARSIKLGASLGVN
jgi:signal peptide peptidase SppA